MLQSCGQFEANTQQVVSQLSSLLEAKLSKLSNDSVSIESTDIEQDTIRSKYESFFRECNAVDMADVFAAVTSACSDSAELAEVINKTSFLIVNPRFHCHLEVYECMVSSGVQKYCY